MAQRIGPRPPVDARRDLVGAAGDRLGQLAGRRDRQRWHVLRTWVLVRRRQVDRLGQERHDDHRQQEDEQQGAGELGHDHGDERILARPAEFHARVSAPSRPSHGPSASLLGSDWSMNGWSMIDLGVLPPRPSTIRPSTMLEPMHKNGGSMVQRPRPSPAGRLGLPSARRGPNLRQNRKFPQDSLGFENEHREVARRLEWRSDPPEGVVSEAQAGRLSTGRRRRPHRPARCPGPGRCRR